MRMRVALVPLAALAVALIAAAPLSAIAAATGSGIEQIPPPPPELRVCADPNNLPYSNRAGEGFENKLAELVADDLGWSLSYTWFAQRRGFVRKTLNAGKCDVIMGVPNLDMISTTRPYYRSTYVFVSRRDRALGFSSMKAPELRTLKIGIHLVGDDGANTPPAEALGQQKIVSNVVGYSIYGDYRNDSPPRALIDAVARGDIDVAAVWGPLAGYYAEKSDVPLVVTPITDTADYLPVVFQYPISMGVRRHDDDLRDRLDDVIYRRRDDIRALLESYGVPLV